jgi:endonuclease YncB( thermonuclease family)
VTCDPREVDRYGRVVAVCRIAGEDLNAWMAREGHAVAYRRYAEDYVNAELTAKALRQGIWAAPSRTHPSGDGHGEPAATRPGPRQ